MSIVPKQNRNVPAEAKQVRLGLIKAVPVVWDLEANWRTFESLATQAVDRGAQLICTPEGFLDGYPVGYDKWGLSKERIREISQSLDGDNYLGRVRDFACKHRVHVVFGFTELAHGGSYNSAALIDSGGKLLGCYHKTHLLHGEDRWFLPGQDIPVWETDLGNIGIMICMDRNFPEVSRTLRLRGANLIIVPSYGGSSLYNEWRMRIRAGDDECFLCFVHPKVGLIVNPQGEIVGKLDAEKPGVLVEEVDMFDTTRIRIAHRRPELYKLSEQANCSPAKRARLQAARRQRRIIFNDDTYELSRPDAKTPEGFLKRRLKPLVDTHVDTISFSVLGGWADAPVYDSKIQPIYGDAHGGPPRDWPGVTASVKALIKAGRCPLQIAIDFAHANRMELFASVRMNDCHDSFIPGGVTIWKKQHPELMVDSDGVPPDKVKHPLGLYVTAQDFSHEQVRQRKFEIIEEVCRRYDIDGLSLNYMRHPVFFSRIMQGLPATVEEVQIMTSFMRRIRGFTDEVAALRGRPLLLSAIVPDNLQLSLNIGLDVKTWLEEDLLDIVIPGLGYAPFTLPVEQWIELAHHHNVPVYPCINKQAPWQVSNDAITEGIRAVAANWYRAGADGIHFWNLGTPFEGKAGQELIDIRQRYYTCLKEVGDPKMLIGKDKLFCADHPVLSYYTHVSSQSPLPVVLKEDVVQCVPLVVADDFGATRNRDPVAVLELQIILKGQVRKEALVFRLNGKLLTDGKFVNAHILYYSLSASQLKTGKNIIEASLKSTTASAVQLQGLQLKTEYKADK